jgi:hypothetical protein
MSYLNQINFNAVVNDVFDMNGKRIDPELGRGVYRDDTGELLSICGPHFKPVQHREVLEPIFEDLDKQGMTLEVRVPDQRALYDLAGRDGAFISPSVTDNGAVMRTDIIVGDFIRPTGASSYMEKGPDTMLRKISVLNSHNQKLAATSAQSWCRVICMNGIVRPDFSVKAYGKHTLNFNIEAFKKKVQMAAEAMSGDADLFGKYARTKLNVKQAEEFIQKTFAKLPNKPNGDAHFSERMVSDILIRFAKEDQTVWGLVQALTEWSTHGEMKANADPLLGRIGREEKVATTLRSSLFDELLAA